MNALQHIKWTVLHPSKPQFCSCQIKHDVDSDWALFFGNLWVVISQPQTECQGHVEAGQVPEEWNIGFVPFWVAVHMLAYSIFLFFIIYLFIYILYIFFSGGWLNLFLFGLILNMQAFLSEDCFSNSVNRSALRHRHLIRAKCALECRRADTCAKTQHFWRKWIANFIAWRCVKITARAIMLIRQLINAAWAHFNHCQSRLETFAWLGGGAFQGVSSICKTIEANKAI